MPPRLDTTQRTASFRLVLSRNYVRAVQDHMAGARQQVPAASVVGAAAAVAAAAARRRRQGAAPGRPRAGAGHGAARLLAPERPVGVAARAAGVGGAGPARVGADVARVPRAETKGRRLARGDARRRRARAPRRLRAQAPRRLRRPAAARAAAARRRRAARGRARGLRRARRARGRARGRPRRRPRGRRLRGPRGVHDARRGHRRRLRVGPRR